MDLKRNSSFACEDHVNIAIDEFINEYEEFPILEQNTEVKCKFCDRNSIYVIK